MSADDQRLAIPYDEAARLLSLSLTTIRRYVADGVLERIGRGRGARITMRSIRRYLAEGSRGA